MNHSRRYRGLSAFAVLIAVVLLTSACFDPLSRAGQRNDDPQHIVVGSGGILEAQIVGQIYIDVLRANGFTVVDQLNSGTRERYIPALRAGDIDVVPDYVGNLLQYLAAKNLPAAEADQLSAVTALPDILQSMPKVLGDDLATGEPSPGSNSDSVTVTGQTAQKWNLRSIADLARVSQREPVTFMANSEFATRPVGVPGLDKNYGLRLTLEPNNDSGGQATINALTSGQVTAANIYTTTPAIETEKLVVLDDPKHNFPANNVVPLIAKSKATPQARKVLDAISAKLTVQALRELNNMVGGSQKLEVEEAASRWVAAQNLNRKL